MKHDLRLRELRKWDLSHDRPLGLPWERWVIFILIALSWVGFFVGLDSLLGG